MACFLLSILNVSLWVANAIIEVNFPIEYFLYAVLIFFCLLEIGFTWV
jgi:hypothetical protein